MSRKKIETSDPNFSIDVYDKKFIIKSYDDRLTLIALGEVLAHFDVVIKEVEDEWDKPTQGHTETFRNVRGRMVHE